MRKENMKFDPKSFEKNSEQILNNKMYDLQKFFCFKPNDYNTENHGLK